MLCAQSEKNSAISVTFAQILAHHESKTEGIAAQ
jgi:hypothetical protein